MRATLFVNEVYQSGQTDGMKLYKIEIKDDVKYVFAANQKDAKMKCKAGLTVNFFDVHNYLKNLTYY